MTFVTYWFFTLMQPDHGMAVPQLGLYSALFSVFSLLMVLIDIAIAAMVAAVILGVLKAPSPAGWLTIKVSIRSYTWRLIILSILLAIIACLVTIPFSFIIAFYGFSATEHGPGIVAHNYFIDFMIMLMAILYLLFVKYALADPLIVIEGMGPLAALKRSWQMTRGRFGYVLGCYVFLGTAEYFIGALLRNYESPHRFTWVKAIELLITSVLTCYWILLAWCMYWRIKQADAPPKFETTPT